MGADPTSSAWKADVLAGKLYLHIASSCNSVLSLSLVTIHNRTGTKYNVKAFPLTQNLR